MSQEKKRLKDLPQHMLGDHILFELCARLHEFRTGSNDSVYAAWGPDPDGQERDIETLQCRLEAWEENDGPFGMYDEAVQNLVRATLLENGEVPRG